MKVKCPKCQHVFEAIENPAPVLAVPPSIPERQLGASFSSISSNHVIGSVRSPSSMPNRNIPLPSMKKGYKEIIDTIEKYQGATWKELVDETHLSTKTLSKRLKEGKETGLFDLDIRKQTGKRIYKCNEKSNNSNIY